MAMSSVGAMEKITKNASAAPKRDALCRRNAASVRRVAINNRGRFDTRPTIHSRCTARLLQVP
jgi:hypothetical protein